MREFSVVGCGLYTPHFPNLSAWKTGIPCADVTPPTGAALDRRSRRISGDLMRALTDVASEAIRAAQVPADTLPSVYGSALGEVQTMLALLQQIWVDHAPPSPMDFAASVHNAASGVASISFKNQSFTTSVAANFDTPAMSIFEGAGLLMQGDVSHVLIVCGDEPPPHRLMGDHPVWDTVCAAVVLAADVDAHDRMGTISLPFRAETTGEILSWPKMEDAIKNNPSAGLFHLVDMLTRGQRGVVRLDAGRGRGWCTQVSPR